MKKNTLAKILEVSRKISSSLDLEQVSELVLNNARDILSADNGALFLLEKKIKKPRLIKAIGFNDDQVENLKLMASWEVISKQMLEKDRTLMVNDMSKSTVFNKEKLPFFKERIQVGAFISTSITLKSRVIGVMIISHNQKRKKKFSVKDKQVIQSFSANVAVALQNAQLYKQTKTMFLNTIAALIKAVEAKDPYTYGHSHRVSQYAMAIADCYGMKEYDVDNIGFSALLHDIGKIGIKDAILLKKGKLTLKQRKKIEQHPMIGANIVASVLRSKDVLQGIEQHHEACNGKGYPKKLKGKSISVFAKILAVADAFDCLTTERPYKKAYAPTDAFKEICACSNKQYDPEVIEAFKRSILKEPEHWNFNRSEF